MKKLIEEMPKGVATFLFELTGSLEQYYRSSDIFKRLGIPREYKF